jgi:hypothetical protein
VEALKENEVVINQLEGGGGGVGPIRKFEITKGVIRSRTSKKERQHID